LERRSLKRKFHASNENARTKSINVNEIVEPKNQETLLHLARRFQFFNVMRSLIEKFNADINIKNANGYSLLYLIASSTARNLVHFFLFYKSIKFRIRYY